MPERRSVISTVVAPVLVTVIGVVGLILVQQERNAQALREAQLELSAAAAEADREVRQLEVFAEMITSPDESRRTMGLRMLEVMAPYLAARLSSAVGPEDAETLVELPTPQPVAADVQPVAADVQPVATDVQPIAEDVEPIAERLQAVTESVRAVAPGSPLIYVHIQDEDDRLAAQSVAGQLVTQGFDVPEIEHLVDMGPPSSQLRFFREVEEDEAREISQILEGIGVSVELTYVAGYEDSRSNRLRHYELWLAPGTPSSG